MGIIDKLNIGKELENSTKKLETKKELNQEENKKKRGRRCKKNKFTDNYIRKTIYISNEIDPILDNYLREHDMTVTVFFEKILKKALKIK